MDIIKKNILSFICAIVALIALIASFWPMGGQYSELEAKLVERKGVFDTADRLIKKDRPIPTTTVDSRDGEKPTLQYFPSPDVIDKGEAAIEQVRAESIKMFDTIVKLNQHELLVTGSLPDLDDVETFAFVREYKERINTYIPNEILKAGAPPTQEDVQKEADALWEKNFAPEENERAAAGGGGRQGADKAVQDQFNEEAAKLPEQMQQRVAKEKKIYLDPLALDATKAMDVSRPNADQIWYAQVGLWVQEDIAASLAAANAQAQSILDAPVKRIIKMDVIEQQNTGIVYITDKSMSSRSTGRGAAAAGPMGMPGMMMGGMGGGYSEPAPAPADGKIAKDFNVSPTGRITSASNTLYDVVHVRLDLVIDAASLAQVIDELQRNKLLTVLRIDEMSGVDAALDQAEGYIYGEHPVIRISMLCEELFLREWTLPLMPQRVKQDLGIQQPASGDATAAANVR